MKDSKRLDELVARTQRERQERERGYRERALGMYPWVCGRCGREFTRANVHELTVHHRDHNHDNNPPDGSNWELLCLYCHDNEHQRHGEARAAGPSGGGAGGGPGNAAASGGATWNPFADLAERLKDSDRETD